MWRSRLPFWATCLTGSPVFLLPLSPRSLQLLDILSVHSLYKHSGFLGSPRRPLPRGQTALSRVTLQVPPVLSSRAGAEVHMQRSCSISSVPSPHFTDGKLRFMESTSARGCASSS